MVRENVALSFARDSFSLIGAPEVVHDLFAGLFRGRKGHEMTPDLELFFQT